MVWATWRNRISSSRSSPWVRDSSDSTFGQPGVDRRVAGDQAVDVGEPEEPAHRVHRGVHRGGHQPRIAQVADVQLDVSPLDPDQRIQPVGLAPGEPAPQLEGVQGVGAAGVAGEERDRRQMSRAHRVGLERQQRGVGHRALLAIYRPRPDRGPPNTSEAPRRQT